MALEKAKTLGSGITASYWVAEPRADAHNKKTNVLMRLYLDKNARDSGKAHLLRQQAGTMDSYLPTGDEVYAFVKASNMQEVDGEQVEQNWFADAEDV